MAETVHGYVVELERILGRPWSDDDHARTMIGLTQVAAAASSVEEEINVEISHLGATGAEAEQLADLLPRYYAMLISEVHSTPTPTPTPEFDDDDDDDFSDLSEDDEEEGGDDVLSQFKTRRCDDDKMEDDQDQESEVCCICLEHLYQGLVTTLDCRHEFHGDCIRRWLVCGQNFCPLCKTRAIRNIGKPWVQPLTEKAVYSWCEAADQIIGR